MRVLLVSDETPLPFEHQKVVTHQSELIEMLEARGCSAAFALLRGEPAVVEGLREGGHSVFPLGFRHYWDAPKAMLRLSRALRAEPVDVVVAREVIPAIIAGVATRIAGGGAISEFIRLHTFGGFKLNSASRVAARLSDHTVAVSRSVAGYAQKLDRVPPSRLHVAYLGRSLRRVSPGEVEEKRRELGIDPEARVVVTVARLRHEKGIDVAIEAVHHVTQGAERAPELVIVGTGPEESTLLDHARVTLGDRAHLVGHKSDVAPWFALGDVLVVPSRKEAFGYTPVEGMSLGLPVVATDVGGLPEVVEDGVTGLLVPPDDPTAMADRLAMLLGSDELRIKMGTAGRERYERLFTMDAMLDRWLRIWSGEIVAGGTRLAAAD